MDGRKRGWIVTLAGTSINLALGVLYAWSVIKAGIPDSWNWSNADKALPYAVACLVFSLAMIPAGRLQDLVGPRWVATIGGVLVGAGFIVSALSGSSLFGFVAGFGILAGAGIGFGYASATPPAVKWFPPEKTGLVAGTVVAGFGLASVYIAPLSAALLQRYGISQTLLIFGVAFLIVVTALSQLLADPPKAQASSMQRQGQDHSLWYMLRSRRFYILWITYFIGAGAGLTFISFAQDLGKRSLGELAFLAVSVLAVGNAGGRVAAGTISDRIGRERTILAFFLMQALAIYLLYLVKDGTNPVLILFLIFLIGANYGSNLSLFPSITKDYFGLASFGLNYGIMFTAWGVSGLFLPWLNGKIRDATGSSDLTFFLIVTLLLFGAALTFKTMPQGKRESRKEVLSHG
jgi:nitrate/nitrite transporter NarK